MQTLSETTVGQKHTTLVSCKGVRKQTNETTVESIESIETFDKRKELLTEKAQKVSTANRASVETIETRFVLSTVSILAENAVESNKAEFRLESIVNSEFQQFQQFQRGSVGGVSQ